MTQQRHKDRLALVAELIELLDELHAVYLKARRATIEGALGTELRSCEKCSRSMIPRRLWDLMSKGMRERLRIHATRAGSKEYCATCVLYEQRSNQLSEETVKRLRQQVGLIQ